MGYGLNNDNDSVCVITSAKDQDIQTNILHRKLLISNFLSFGDLMPMYQQLLQDSSTLFLKEDITWAGSTAPNTELPATIQFAPAEAAASMVEGPKPPSTCMLKKFQGSLFINSELLTKGQTWLQCLSKGLNKLTSQINELYIKKGVPGFGCSLLVSWVEHINPTKDWWDKAKMRIKIEKGVFNVIPKGFIILEKHMVFPDPFSYLVHNPGKTYGFLWSILLPCCTRWKISFSLLFLLKKEPPNMCIISALSQHIGKDNHPLSQNI